MDRQTVKSYLDPTLGTAKFTVQGLKYCCPQKDCDPSQSKFNLEICLLSSHKHYHKFHCWACHYRGHIKHLFKDYAYSDSWHSIRELHQYVEYSGEKIEKHEDLPITIPYHLSKEVKDYLVNVRGISEQILSERKVCYCYNEDEPLYNRIIFPFIEDKKLIGFSSQDFKTKKYKNHRDLNFVPYKNFLNLNYPIIVTEGIYDSYSVPNAIPLLGTKPSIELYKFCQDKKVILALDSDVSLEEKKAIADNFYYYGAKIVAIFELKEYKDLNEYYTKEKDLFKSELKILFELLNET